MFAELKALVALAETGSMERAASHLHLTPSALTRRIQRLEVELDVVLLDRHFKPPESFPLKSTAVDAQLHGVINMTTNPDRGGCDLPEKSLAQAGEFPPEPLASDRSRQSLLPTPARESVPAGPSRQTRATARLW